MKTRVGQNLVYGWTVYEMPVGFEFETTDTGSGDQVLRKSAKNSRNIGTNYEIGIIWIN